MNYGTGGGLPQFAAAMAKPWKCIDENWKWRVLAGIYKITCLPTGKFYVGSSGNMWARLSAHRTRLRHNKHSNCHLQCAWNRYGEADFSWDIIEHVRDKEMLASREQWWLDKTRCYERDVGFNKSRVASFSGVAGKGGKREGKEYRVVSPVGNCFTINNLSAFCKSNGLDDRLMKHVGGGWSPGHKGWICWPASIGRDEWIRKINSRVKRYCFYVCYGRLLRRSISEPPLAGFVMDVGGDFGAVSHLCIQPQFVIPSGSR